MVIFAGASHNLKGIEYFDLLSCHNHSLTKPNIFAKCERNHCFELYHLLPGFLVATLVTLVKEDMHVCSVCIMGINFLIETREVES